MISRIKQKPKQIFSWYNRDSIETNKGKEASAMGRQRLRHQITARAAKTGPYRY